MKRVEYHALIARYISQHHPDEKLCCKVCKKARALPEDQKTLESLDLDYCRCRATQKQDE